jgi:hypothetical protein
MIAATRQIGESLELSAFQHYRCPAHILNLSVSAAFLQHSKRLILTAFGTLVNQFKDKRVISCNSR